MKKYSMEFTHCCRPETLRQFPVVRRIEIDEYGMIISDAAGRIIMFDRREMQEFILKLVEEGFIKSYFDFGNKEWKE